MSEALQNALAAHAETLVPGAAPQLAKLWAEDLSTLPPGLVADHVRMRLASPEYAHFRKESPEAPQPTASDMLISLERERRLRSAGSNPYALGLRPGA